MSFLPLMTLVISLTASGQEGQLTTQNWRCPFFSWGEVASRYDPSKEETINAKIRRVHLTKFGEKDLAVSLVVDQGKPGLIVIVGPASYVSANQILFSRGLSINCTGAMQVVSGRKVLIAREIALGDRKITLRDRGGAALWKSKVP